MGETKTSFELHANGEVADLEAVVDTGAAFTRIPANVSTKLGLQAQSETEVGFGNGRTINRGFTLVEVEIEPVRRPTLVTIGEEGEKPVIGYTTERDTQITATERVPLNFYIDGYRFSNVYWLI